MTTYYGTGINGRFSDASSWDIYDSSGQLVAAVEAPGASDNVFVPASGGFGIYYTVTIDLPAAANTLTVAGNWGETTLEVNSTLTVASVLEIDEAHLNVESGGIVNTSTLIVGPADVQLNSGGTINVGTLTLNKGAGLIDSGNLVISGTMQLIGEEFYGPTVEITGGNTLTLACPVMWDGVMTGAGTLVTTGNTTITTLAAVDGGLVWNNSGTVTVGGFIALGWPSGVGAPTVNNLAGGVFDFTSDGYAFSVDSPQGAVVNNAGVLAKTAGTGTTIMGLPVINTGTITASSGTLELVGGVLSGTLGATGVGVLALNGNFTVGGTEETITGSLALDGGTVSIGAGQTLTLSGAFTLNGAGADYYGPQFNGPGTLLTTGSVTINGSAQLDGSLVWDNSGTVSDGGTLTFGWPSGAGTLTVNNLAGGEFDITADGAPFQLGWNSTANLILNNAGTLAKTGGTGTSLITADIVNTGTILAASGTLDIAGNVTGTGTLTFDPGTLLLEGTVAATEHVVFTGGDETLILGPNADMLAPISGFGPGDEIALEGQQVTSAVYSSATQTLAITGSTGKVFDLTIVGTYQPNDFVVANGEVVSGEVICFMPGTLIRTPDGERAVESLAIGAQVLTAEGEVKPVLWIGRQTVSRVFADPLRVLPIRITAGALDQNMPVRDLLVSPDHALLVGGVLIQAGALVNGSTIRREEDVPAVFSYYHVELADHALLLAEGVPAETFVDNVDRMGFDNWDEHAALYPEGRTVAELPLPRAKSHRQVPMAVRRNLAACAAALHLPAVAA